MRKYDAIFLDAQGTLLKPQPSTAGIYAGVCARFGKRAGQRRVGVVLAELWAEHREHLRAQGAGRYDTSEEATRLWGADFNGRVFRRLKMEGEPEPFLEALWDVFGRPESWRLFPEVKGVVAELRRRGYRLGIVSNWDSRLLPICEGLGLASDLDFLLASAATGMEKPDPRIFEIALARAGVPASRALHVGDDYEADILGARAAGLDALLIDRDGHPPTDARTIRTLEELPEILAFSSLHAS